MEIESEKVETDKDVAETTVKTAVETVTKTADETDVKTAETYAASNGRSPANFKDFCISCLTVIHKFVSKFQYNSPVILTYAIASFVVLLIAMLTNNKSTVLLFSVYGSPLTDPLAYIRVFGYILGHDGFAHLFNNFLLILLVGPALEEKYGSIKLLIMILLTALSTGILHMLVAGSNQMLLGASGVLFMMIVLSSFVNLRSGKIPLTFVLVVLVFLGRELVDVVYLSDNISRFTHIFGGACGVIFGFIFNRSKLFGKKKGDTATE